MEWHATLVRWCTSCLGPNVKCFKTGSFLVIMAMILHAQMPLIRGTKLWLLGAQSAPMTLAISTCQGLVAMCPYWIWAPNLQCVFSQHTCTHVWKDCPFWASLGPWASFRVRGLWSSESEIQKTHQNRAHTFNGCLHMACEGCNHDLYMWSRCVFIPGRIWAVQGVERAISKSEKGAFPFVFFLKKLSSYWKRFWVSIIHRNVGQGPNMTCAKVLHWGHGKLICPKLRHVSTVCGLNLPYMLDDDLPRTCV
jgi:hypothetical protein